MSTQRGLSYPPISGRHIIFSGIAGACQISGLNKEDVIIADCIYGYKYGKIGGGFKSRGNWTFKTDLGLMTGAIGIHGNPVHLWSAPSEGEGNDVRGTEERDDWKPYSNSMNWSTDSRACFRIWERVERRMGLCEGTVSLRISLSLEVCFWRRIWLPFCLTTTQPSLCSARTTWSYHKFQKFSFRL